MRRVLFFAYGLVCYCMFFCVFLYAIGFIGNLFVPRSLDSAPIGSTGTAIVINTLLLGVFAIQHSVMARPWFKAVWTKFVPKPIERSTYVLFSNLAMMLIFAFWRPMGGTIWNIEGTGRMVIYGLFALGWMTVFYATCLVNHFDLFGLRQVWLHLLGEPYTQLRFREPSLYRHVRHPLYVGWLMVMWFAPMMTASHLFFAVGTTAYILIAIQFEERDLVKLLPGYAEYRSRVPMLVPSFFSKREQSVVEPVSGTVSSR